MKQALFHAHLLFDGEQWQRSCYFQVDPQGMFTELEPSALEESAKAQAQSFPVVIPGFVNCHSHSFQRGMAGLSEGLSQANAHDSFWTWREQMYGLAHTLTPETFRVIADWLYVEMLEAGYTSVGEFHYLHKKPTGEAYENPCEMAQQLAESAQETQIRLCLLPTLYQQSGMGKPLLDKQRPFGMKTLEDYENYRQALLAAVSVPQGVALHSLRAVGHESLLNFLRLYENQNLPIHIHIAEQQGEVEESLAFYGQRPVEFLLQEANVGAHWTLIHATHITPEEREAIVQSGATVGICPITEANLGDGIFPLKEFLQAGGTLAIGSDSHIRLDPFEELRWLEYSQRYRFEARACLADEQNLSVGHLLASRCYLGGAASLQMKVGALRTGHQADFIVLRTDHPSMLRQNPQTLWDELIFAGSRELVEAVYVGGVPVVFQGKHRLREEKLQALRCLFQSDVLA